MHLALHFCPNHGQSNIYNFTQHCWIKSSPPSIYKDSQETQKKRLESDLTGVIKYNHPEVSLSILSHNILNCSKNASSESHQCYSTKDFERTVNIMYFTMTDRSYFNEYLVCAIPWLGMHFAPSVAMTSSCSTVTQLVLIQPFLFFSSLNDQDPSCLRIFVLAITFA